MKKPQLLVSSFAALSLVAVSGCVTDPNTGQQKVSRTAIGAVGGALAGGLLGDVIGGKTGRIIGAGVGGIAGGVVGDQLDDQIRQLKESTAGSGVEVEKTPDGSAIMVNLPDGVTFDTSSYVLKPQFRTTLTEIANSLNQYPNSLVDVLGHTDSTGSSSYNQTLSENRARTVANFLSSQGVSANRIRSQGFGMTMPVASNDTVDGRARNRRVEIKIVPITQEDVQAARQGQ